MEVINERILPTNYCLYKIKYTKDDLNEVIEKASLIENKLNVNDPSGEKRDSKTISVKNLGGLISEKVVTDLLKSIALYKNPELEIIDSNWKEIQNSLYQVDHQIKINNKVISIETRSSFSYKTKCPEKVVNGAFSIIGPYTTQSKSKEHYKDMYAFAFYCIHPDKLFDMINSNELTIYFAGGATIDMLESSEDNLKQNNATYLTLKPINRGLDAKAFFRNILKKENDEV